MSGWRIFGTIAFLLATVCSLVGMTGAAISFGLSALGALYVDTRF